MANKKKRGVKGVKGDKKNENNSSVYKILLPILLMLLVLVVLFIVIPHSLLWGSGDLVSRACSGVNTRLFLVFGLGITGNALYSNCVDSDNTTYPIVSNVEDDESYFIAGNVTQGYTTVSDFCEDINVVSEFYCEKGAIRNAKFFGCPTDCKNGACAE